MPAEIPVGAVDGTNAVFTLSTTPTTAVLLFVDRMAQVEGTDFALAGQVVTFTAGAIPPVGSIVRAYYNSSITIGPSVGQVTLASLRLQVRQKADMVNSQFVTDSELTGYVNSAYYELYDLLVQKFGNDYYVATSYLFTADGTADSYALPLDFYKVLGLEIQDDGTHWSPVRKYSQGDRYGVGYDAVPRYRLRGSFIAFSVAPKSGKAYRLWYVPRLSPLIGDSDLVDGVSGWEEYIVTDAAIACLAKEESDTSQLERERQGLTQRIEAAAENRDTGGPFTVQDTRNDGWVGGIW